MARGRGLPPPSPPAGPRPAPPRAHCAAPHAQVLVAVERIHTRKVNVPVEQIQEQIVHVHVPQPRPVPVHVCSLRALVRPGAEWLRGGGGGYAKRTVCAARSHGTACAPSVVVGREKTGPLCGRRGSSGGAPSIWSGPSWAPMEGCIRTADNHRRTPPPQPPSSPSSV